MMNHLTNLEELILFTVLLELKRTQNVLFIQLPVVQMISTNYQPFFFQIQLDPAHSGTP